MCSVLLISHLAPKSFKVDAGITHHYSDNNVLCVFHVPSTVQSDLIYVLSHQCCERDSFMANIQMRKLRQERLSNLAPNPQVIN